MTEKSIEECWNELKKYKKEAMQYKEDYLGINPIQILYMVLIEVADDGL